MTARLVADAEALVARRIGGYEIGLHFLPTIRRDLGPGPDATTQGKACGRLRGPGGRGRAFRKRSAAPVEKIMAWLLKPISPEPNRSAEGAFGAFQADALFA